MINNQQLIPMLDPEQEAIRQERRAARRRRRNARRHTQIILGSALSVALVLLGLIGFIYLQIQSRLAYNGAYPPINGETCDSSMHTTYHIHVHLTIYIQGERAPIPQGIGIAADGSCYYWMHTHTSDGIIHIEAPGNLHNVALNDFLTIWHDGFARLAFPSQLNAATGWKIYINGRLFAGKVTSPLQTVVPLASHDVVTLEYGPTNTPPDTIYAFPPDLPQ